MIDLAPEGSHGTVHSGHELKRGDLEDVLGTVSEGVVVCAPGGRIVYANSAAARLLGVRPGEDVVGVGMEAHRRRFELFDAAGQPLDPARLPGERARSPGDDGELLVRFRPADGGEENVAVTRAVRLLDDDGDLRYVVSVFRTVTQERAAETLRRLELVTRTALASFSLADLVPSLLAAIREALAADTAALLLFDAEGTELREAFADGYEGAPGHAAPPPFARLARGAAAPWVVEEPDEIERVSPALRARGVRSLVVVPLLVDGRTIGVAHAGSRRAGRFVDEDRRLFRLLADRVAVAVNHSLLLDAERAAQERLAFLGEVSSVLASSLDYEETLSRIAHLVVPRLADWCAVDVLASDGSIVRLATAHVDPAKVRWAWEISARFPLDPAAGEGVPRVLRTGEPELAGEVTPAMLARFVEGRPALRAILDEIGLTSAMIVPIAARGRTLGAISFFWAESGRHYTADDLEFAVDLARRAAVAVDNAELYREAEERAEAARVLAAVGDGVVLVDSSGAVRYWNRAAETITGLPRTAVVERPAVEAIPGWESVVERVPVTADPGQTPRPVSLPFTVGARELWLSVSGVAVVDGTVYAFRDLTEDRALETLKAEFVSTVSHELRTPLAAIYGAAMTLRREDIVLDREQRDTLLAVVGNESDRLARTVDGILWASRLDAATLSTSIVRCDAAALAQEVIEAQWTHLPAHVRLRLEVEEELPPVAADPDHVRQVLVNLLDNAVKYSPGGGTVSLAVRRELQHVRFAVSDEGLGIPHADQRRIFDKFYRVDPEMSQGIGGTGLGLYISRELVRRMDGQLHVSSDPGRGSTFTVELPIA